MRRFLRSAILLIAFGAPLAFAERSACAGQIIELSLGGTATIDVEFDGNVLATDGPQPTAVIFKDILDGTPDIATATASFTLDGLTKSGPATVMGTLVIQKFAGGTFELHHPDSTLLLSGQLSSSGLVGTIDEPDGTLFTSMFSTVTGGSLASELDPSSLVLQMHFVNVAEGAGHTVIPAGALSGDLQPFTAQATVDIEASPSLVPEPATIGLIGFVVIALVSLRGSARRG